MKLVKILLPAALLIISFQISAPVLIYKKNGEIVNAKILKSSQRSICFKNYNAHDSITYFHSVSAIYSSIFQNGVKDTFVAINSDKHSLTHNLSSTFNHHLIGFDLSGFLIFRNLTFSYEYLPLITNIGFKAAFAKNVEKVSYPGLNFNRYPNWSNLPGDQLLLFTATDIPFETGLFYIFGKYSMVNYYYIDPSPTPVVLTGNSNMSGVIMSAFEFLI